MAKPSKLPTGLTMLAPALLALAACTAPTPDQRGAGDASEAAGRLVLQVEKAETVAGGHSCVFGVKARNDTGAPALNVQAAWTAQTEGFGFISDYQVLGDFAAGEIRAMGLGVTGAPCSAVRDLELTRAVCTVGPAVEPPQSCAALVKLDGGGVVPAR